MSSCCGVLGAATLFPQLIFFTEEAGRFPFDFEEEDEVARCTSGLEEEDVGRCPSGFEEEVCLFLESDFIGLGDLLL